MTKNPITEEEAFRKLCTKEPNLIFWKVKGSNKRKNIQNRYEAIAFVLILKSRSFNETHFLI